MISRLVMTKLDRIGRRAADILAIEEGLDAARLSDSRCCSDHPAAVSMASIVLLACCSGRRLAGCMIGYVAFSPGVAHSHYRSVYAALPGAVNTPPRRTGVARPWASGERR